MAQSGSASFSRSQCRHLRCHSREKPKPGTTSSLQFRGFLYQCSERFVRFDEKGRPVRAFLNCTFIEHREYKNLLVANPLNSPDTTKYHTVRQGDSLWSLAAEEYGDAGKWREIAAANGISNPRRLRSGETLVVPALV